MKCFLLCVLVLVLCAHQLSARGGGRGGGSRGGSRGSGSRSSSSSKSSWFSSSSKSSSSSHSTSSSSKGNWFTNLFSSKPSATSSSSTSSSAKPNYPRQPAHNPSVHAGAPPSYGSLFPHAGKVGQGSHSAPPPSYGWATGATAGAGNKAPQRTMFNSFTPQNHQTSSSYNFIPIILPHSHSYHYGHSYYGSRASASSNAASSTAAGNGTANATAASPITAPIIYELDTRALRPDDRQSAPAALVVAVNNMLVYGDLQPGQHLVMVVDERFVDPGEIPAQFLDFIDEDEVTDYQPTRRTTTTTTTTTTETSTSTTSTDMPDPKLRIMTTTTEATVAITPAVVSNVSPKVSSDDYQAVFNNQWFSDVDGGI